jgi:aminobenzoyl-glutamate utilization protein B
MRSSRTAVRTAVAFGAAALAVAVPLALDPSAAAAQTREERRRAREVEQRLDRLHQEATEAVDARRKQVQVLVDSIFSFAELGFQEVETSALLTGILREHGFAIEEGVSGIPTAWFARWGSGEPVIALGSDLDCIPKASQKPGVAYHDPLVEGGPGHGEGHNSGQAVNVTAALVVQEIMKREGLPGTLVLWPGVAEELVASKAWFVRDGWFDDVDVVLFTHVSNDFSVSWGNPRGTGLVSVEYTFSGEAAHSAGRPWRGRSALDAVELMNLGWNVRREHLRPVQRSHYVITDGGDQPNVVPSTASVWYYFRELAYPEIVRMREIGDRVAQGAALMTDTEVGARVLGAAWPRHFNKVVAEVVQRHIEAVGMPEWSEADQALARAVQEELGSEERDGLKTAVEPLKEPPETPESGGSDDIGDVSWKAPTVTLAFPANIPDLPGHHWANAIAMATPIAHKGATAGAMVVARSVLDFLLRPELVEQAWTYYREVQTKEQQYQPLISADDPPPIHLNRTTMETFRELQRPYYYDPSRFDTYLEQLGIEYPTLRPEPAETASEGRPD